MIAIITLPDNDHQRGYGRAMLAVAASRCSGYRILAFTGNNPFESILDVNPALVTAFRQPALWFNSGEVVLNAGGFYVERQ